MIADSQRANLPDPVGWSARGRKLRLTGWWFVLIVFAGLGLYRWWLFVLLVAPDFSNPDAGLDALAHVHFGLDHGAAKLRDEVAPIAPGDAILVVGPGNDWTLTEAYFLISYLAWPRAVWCLGATAPGERARFDNPPPAGLKPSALFFYKIAPPPGAGGERIGDRLVFVRRAP